MPNTTIYIYDENGRYKKSRSGSIDMLMATVEANNESYTLTQPPLTDPCSYMWVGSEWVLNDNKSIKIKQDTVWSNIKYTRDILLSSGVLVESVDKVFQTDNDSMIQYSNIAAMIALDNYDPIEWKTEDNSFILLTVELFKELQQAISINTQRLFKVAEHHKAGMLEATNPLEYDYSKGWV